MNTVDENAIFQGALARACDDFMFIDDVSHEACDGLLELYHNPVNLFKFEGKCGMDSYGVQKEDVKESVDVCVPVSFNQPAVQQYFKELNSIVEKYVQKFPFSGMSPFSMREPMALQGYPKGGGFKIWHSERTSAYVDHTRRHLVFMTYLNDVPNGGTEWFHQQRYIDAVKGKTVIWPADWTYLHKGRISHDHEKYIATGWFEYGDRG